MKNLFIVITDFNGYAQTQRCLDALRTGSYSKFTVLVVDHGTTDETRVGLARDFPDVIRLEGSSELWWAGANNLGIRFALERGADAIMLLNNDCYVAPDAISVLVESLVGCPDAVIAAVQRDRWTGHMISISPRSCFLLGFPSLSGPKNITPYMATRELLPVKLIVGGRGVIIPVEIFTQVGLFDEKRLPHYGADHDFYLRIRKRNIPLYVSLGAEVQIDNTRTTSADNPGALNFAEFLQSLTSRRSHRNLRDVTALFRVHYPIYYLYSIGVFLFILRYFLVYFFKRSIFLMWNSTK